MIRKRKISISRRSTEDPEDIIVEQRIKQRTETYISKFKGSIERTYREYIASRHWTNRKVAYFATHKKECALCHSTIFVELNHIYYGNFGYEKDEDLIPLCSSHHEALHRYSGVSRDMRYATADFVEWQRDLRSNRDPNSPK